MLKNDKTDIIKKAVAKGRQDVSNVIAINITAEAKKLAPVAAYFGGNLKGSIQWVGDDGKSGGKENQNALTTKPPSGGAVVGTPVDYGVYQEFGTRNMSAQPFMRPAADIVTKGSSVKKAMARAMDESVRGAIK
jgi:HK97 gp10 family phage protein